MVRAAVLIEVFDYSYEDLEERLKSTTLVSREVGFRLRQPSERHDPVTGDPRS